MPSHIESHYQSSIAQMQAQIDNSKIFCSKLAEWLDSRFRPNSMADDASEVLCTALHNLICTGNEAFIKEQQERRERLKDQPVMYGGFLENPEPIVPYSEQARKLRNKLDKIFIGCTELKKAMQAKTSSAALKKATVFVDVVMDMLLGPMTQQLEHLEIQAKAEKKEG